VTETHDHKGEAGKNIPVLYSRAKTGKVMAEAYLIFFHKISLSLVFLNVDIFKKTAVGFYTGRS
jgi:hypothetical protein